jgi:hypothetical protein
MFRCASVNLSRRDLSKRATVETRVKIRESVKAMRLVTSCCIGEKRATARPPVILIHKRLTMIVQLRVPYFY